jgi:hypothetical protein
MSARFLAESFFDPTMFPSHTLTSSEEATGKEVERVGSARRQARDHWTPTTDNVASWVSVACDRTRYADTFALDRGHNLDGKTVRLRVSDHSDFATYTEVATITVPSTVYYGSRLDVGVPVRTEEGAVVCAFNGHAGKYWRLVVDAMGASTKPKIVGLWVGKSWTPDINPVRPWDDEARELAFDSVVSPSLWSAAERKAQRKSTAVTVRLSGEQEYSDVRYHIHSLYWRGYAMWYVADTNKGERTWLAMSPAGTFGAPFDTAWLNRTIQIPLVEHEPEPR